METGLTLSFWTMDLCCVQPFGCGMVAWSRCWMQGSNDNMSSTHLGCVGLLLSCRHLVCV
jgi:hypothetical protein